ncbi:MULTISPECIES: hypothetical protein [Bacillus]|uniref:hypothetical protein n=1 Tax=Bacillus TaxID=1386 RepID=UPI0008FE2FB1|nr:MULTISPECIES: hypothetical protein [Bacillus]MDA1758200.1 hypothetical protein [Bacillus cereus]AXO96200.1 hypothetical protein DY471_28020 [Bacillus anthracis]MCX9103015.1 hypothetical protein [Bacillus anthracis]MDA2672235.1 hypothetical protein [Bacillus cereus]OJD83089.1 hypothetical protein MCCC1A01412_27180 [Bacillus anthracis]
MFKKLVIGTLATGIIFSGAAGASAAELKTKNSVVETEKSSQLLGEYHEVAYSKESDIKPTITVNGKTLYLKTYYFNVNAVLWIALYQ